MSAAHLDAIKKKYNFKEISVASWRHPATSTLPLGAVKQPVISPEAASKPYQPTYKWAYKPPEATDDEDDEDEEEQESDAADEGMFMAIAIGRAI